MADVSTREVRRDDRLRAVATSTPEGTEVEPRVEFGLAVRALLPVGTGRELTDRPTADDGPEDDTVKGKAIDDELPSAGLAGLELESDFRGTGREVGVLERGCKG